MEICISLRFLKIDHRHVIIQRDDEEMMKMEEGLGRSLPQRRGLSESDVPSIKTHNIKP